MTRVPVVQWIERSSPKGQIQVRFLAGTPVRAGRVERSSPSPAMRAQARRAGKGQIQVRPVLSDVEVFLAGAPVSKVKSKKQKEKNWLEFLNFDLDFFSHLFYLKSVLVVQRIECGLPKP